MTLMRVAFYQELKWTAGVFSVLAVLGVVSGDLNSTAAWFRLLARSLCLAAFPSGIAVAPMVFDPDRSPRDLAFPLAAATIIALGVFALTVAGTPALPVPAPEDWEGRNHQAWVSMTSWLAGITAFLYAAIGAQIGVWTRSAIPRPLQRSFYWIVGLGLVLSGYVVSDSTYETIVIHTAADVSFAAFYTVLIPLSICAGLGLPTLTLLQRGAASRQSS